MQLIAISRNGGCFHRLHERAIAAIPALVKSSAIGLIEKSRGFAGRGLSFWSEIRTNYLVESSRFLAAKSQLTLVQNPSMNFGRRLR